MGDIALWVTFEALPGKDQEAENFFAGTGETVATEAGTTGFHAVQIGLGKYAIFKTCADETALEAHQIGPAGKDAVTGAVGVILAAAPEMGRSIVLYSKTPGVGFLTDAAGPNLFRYPAIEVIDGIAA